ncbi:fibrinolytic enzyme, isozyme C-like [Mizuhopecten yessoensis]|uniref:Testisin n=1 Tax=Mizuhopecten yessoensis TaxID=6573 RepID=A0A210QA72_MIZYE|nr:fibrinolytic enzyme, isozyme C-like [Mizuhopecten yessoensis]OWF45605.1 Testisin [Mizuhopecten yessoensis]
MAVWLLCLVFSGCLAFPEIPTPHHPGQDLIDLALQTQADLKGESRIVGGDDAYINNYPWQASLRSYGQHICGAVILSEDFVLTAAHCVGNSASTYSIRVGSSSRVSGGSTHSVSNVLQHENFQNSPNTGEGAFPNDIAIMKLSSSISFNSNKQPISLTSATNAQLAGYNEEDCVITGWGRTSSDSDLPTQLQKTNVKVLTDAVCTPYIGSNYLNGDIHICLDGAGASGSCNGDSGGPLACRVGNEFELAGVTSFGLVGCPTNSPSVYAETYAFRTWVQNAMKSM